MFDLDTEGLPEPRLLNDFSDVPVAGQPGDQAEYPGSITEETGESAPEQALEDSEAFRQMLDDGDKVVVDYLREAMKQADKKRESYQFSWRNLRNRIRAANYVWINVDNCGNMIYGNAYQWDGNPYGTNQTRRAYPGKPITQGWTACGIRSAADYCNGRLFESGDWVQWTDPSNKQEGRKLSRCLTKASAAQFKRTKFTSKGRLMLYGVFERGTNAMRMEFVRPVETERTEDGGYVEKIGNVKTVITLWPIEDVLFSNPEKPNGEDQEMVWWISRGKTVHDLEADEAVFEETVDEMTGMRTRSLVSGKYTRLNKLRDLDRNGPTEAVNQMSTRTMGMASTSQISGDLSSYPTFNPVDYRGSCPIAFWLDKEMIKPEYLQYHGINVGPAPDRENKPEWNAYLRRISKEKMFYVTYVDGDASTAGSASDGTVLQFAKCPYEKPRNELYLFKAYPDGTRAYGFSIADRAYKMEDAADIIMNAGVWTEYFNAYPSTIGDPALFRSNYGDEVQRVFTPLEQLQKKAGMKASEMLEVMQLDNGNQKLEWIEYLHNQFNNLIGVTEAAQTGQGAGTTGTLGQLNQEQQAAQRNMDGVIAGIIDELDRMVSDNLEMMQDAMGHEEFVQYLERVSGEDSAGIEELLWSVDGLTDEYEVSHPIAFGKDKTVLAQGLLNDFGVIQPAAPNTYNATGTASVLAMLRGLTNTDLFITAPDIIMEPEDEQDQMKQGNAIKPSPSETLQQLVQHVTTHEEEMRRLVQGDTDVPPENQEMYFELLRKHLALEVKYLQIAEAAVMPPAPMPMNGGDGQGADKPRKGGERATAKGLDDQTYGGIPAEGAAA